MSEPGKNAVVLITSEGSDQFGIARTSYEERHDSGKVEEEIFVNPDKHSAVAAIVVSRIEDHNIAPGHRTVKVSLLARRDKFEEVREWMFSIENTMKSFGFNDSPTRAEHLKVLGVEVDSGYEVHACVLHSSWMNLYNRADIKDAVAAPFDALLVTSILSDQPEIRHALMEQVKTSLMGASHVLQLEARDNTGFIGRD